MLVRFIRIKLRRSLHRLKRRRGMMGGVWGGKGSDLAIQAPFPPQEKYTKS